MMRRAAPKRQSPRDLIQQAAGLLEDMIVANDTAEAKAALTEIRQQVRSLLVSNQTGTIDSGKIVEASDNVRRAYVAMEKDGKPAFSPLGKRIRVVRLHLENAERTLRRTTDVS